MVPANSRKVSPASRYSGYPPSCHRYAYRTITVYGWAFQTHSTSNNTTPAGPTTPNPVGPGLGYSPFARHYLGNHYCFLFLLLLRCFSSPAYASSKGYPLRDGLPHSDIHGSTLLCSSPWLFAALHVLHRLCMPRHPPCALNHFNYKACTRSSSSVRRTKTPNTSSQ